jgi:hypothetical protein
MQPYEDDTTAVDARYPRSTFAIGAISLGLLEVRAFTMILTLICRSRRVCGERSDACKSFGSSESMSRPCVPSSN